MLDGEAHIVKSAVRGEASAFGRLYDHYQPKIYRFVLVKVSHREEAEDLTHQVFLSAWQNIERYQDVGHPFSSWLYRIARNQIIDHYRTRKPTVTIDEVDPNEFAVVNLTELTIENRLALGKVLRAVRTLKQDYQDVIIMRYVEDLSPKEVAAVFGKSEGAVKLLQHRAVKQLRALLNDPTTIS